MAKASEISAENDTARTLLEAAKTSPMLSQMTTPMHEFPPSSKAAASVLTLKKPVGGGFYFDKEKVWGKTGKEQAALNSAMTLPAISQAWIGGEPESSQIAWLQLHQIDQATEKKSSRSFGEPSAIKSKATSTKP